MLKYFGGKTGHLPCFIKYPVPNNCFGCNFSIRINYLCLSDLIDAGLEEFYSMVQCPV